MNLCKCYTAQNNNEGKKIKEKKLPARVANFISTFQDKIEDNGNQA
jgi:hypothetical protein